MSATDYHADKTRISKHGLDLIRRAPMAYEHERHAPPREQTPAMRMGELVHLATFEPAEFSASVATLPPGLDRRTKAGKEAYELLSGYRHIVTPDERESIIAMAEAAHVAGGALLRGASVEETIHWERSGVRCKSRIDGRKDGVLFDLKTTTDITRFEREAFAFRYHVQAAFYLDAVRACEVDADQFAFIVVEKTAPYLSTVYWVDADVIHNGREEYVRDLETYKTCMETDTWPGLPQHQTLTLPQWKR